MNQKLIEAINFAARAHKKQTRKVDDSPYINHLLEVCNILAYAGIENNNILTAAILHDVIEDTETSREQVSYLFGNEVAKIVKMLSDDKNLSPVLRKEATKVLLAKGENEYLAIKLADLISNMLAIPKLWDEVKIGRYLSQCAELLKSVPKLKYGSLQLLFDLATYILDAQTNGSLIYNELCELARQEQLLWSQTNKAFINTDAGLGGQKKGFLILSDISTLFQLGLLRSLQLSSCLPANINIKYSVDENFKEASFEQQGNIVSAVKVVLTH
jgi:hypothetical protein